MRRTETTVTDVLLNARDRLIPAGNWCQHAYNDNGAVCMVGAVEQYAGHGTLPWTKALNRLRRVTDSESVTRWNDAPDRTHQEVIGAFNRALGA